MKRLFDFVMSMGALCFFSLPMLFIALIVKLTSEGPAIYWSTRVGKDNMIFKMPKFRTMRKDVPEVATHLLEDINRHLTPVWVSCCGSPARMNYRSFGVF